MTKIIIDLEDGSKTQKFKKNDIIIYNGKNWYVTTIESLCERLETRYNNQIAKIDRKINELNQEYAKFMQQYNEQNSKLLPIIEKLLEKDEEK